jgi:hypothetical protein
MLHGEKKILHIFEQRYRNLFEDIKGNNNILGIPFVRFGKALSSGILVQNENIIKTYPSGEFDVMIKGLGYLNVIDFHSKHPERLYPFGEVEVLQPVKFQPEDYVIKEFESYCENVLHIEPDKFPVRSLLGISTILGLIDWEKYDLVAGADEAGLNKRILNLIRMKTYLYNQHGIVFDNYSTN